MNFARTYLDYNASAPLLPQAREAISATLALDGNPSSVHGEGRRLRGIIEAARDEVAALAGARPADVVFTSGATEANVMALGCGWDTIFLSGLEHDCVLAPSKASGARVVEVPVLASGVIDAGRFAAEVLTGSIPLRRAVVALQMANNETGVLQPVAEVAAFAREHGVSCHTDAVQAAGRIAIDFDALGVDTLALSAHKIGGPKGVGALIVRDGFEVGKLICGGGQERRRRAGTENVAGIAGFGAAARVAAGGVVEFARLAALRDRLEQGVLQLTPQAVIFGRDAERVANTSAIGLAGKASEIAVIKFDVAGFAVSAGSACSSGKVGASQVLMAMGGNLDAARGAIRISIGPATRIEEVDAFLSAWREIHKVSVSAGRGALTEFGIGGQASVAVSARGE
ncbi:MAG: cysteine desulfurase family protein [Hyphomicrobiaceae bacterium]